MSPTQNQTRHKIHQLIEKYQGMTEGQRREITEAGVVHQFLDPFLEALGWPINDPARYKYELSTQAGRPDMTLIPERGGTIFVEAKRFSVIEELEQARKTIAGIVTPGQMALPGMATDRTGEEQQAINYAFKNGGTWAILTNFEKLRLFNARRDWLVLSFERPGAYLDEFDLLWQLSYTSVCSGGLDALSNQRHRGDVDTDYLNFINEWREKLAQDIVARPDDNPWVFTSDGRINLADLRAVVQRVLDRLVVVRFAEDHLIAPAGALYSLYELHKTNPYTFTLSEFFRQLYRRFDRAHNSALFAPDLTDEAVFGDEVLSGLIQKLYEARYRAMSADIMGNTYEQYLGKTLAQSDGDVITVDNLETRKKQGSYYTPQVIVRYLVDNSLGRYLYGTANGRPDGEPLPDEQPKTADDVEELRVLDMACGSGSFLIYAYEVLADFYRREIDRLKKEREQRRQELVQEGVTTPIDVRIELAPWTAKIERLQNYPRLILEMHLYGVDLDPQAAEIATVNLIMRAMADQRSNKRRLPLILNQNVKVGNSLIGAGPADSRYADHAADLAELRRLRLKLAAEGNGPDHQDILEAIDEVAGPVNAALNQDLVEHFQDVDTHRPFNWAVEFPEAFLDDQGQHLGEAAGFEVIIGNPPYVQIKQIPWDDRKIYQSLFKSAVGRFNLFYFFLESAEKLARSGGISAFIVPDRLLLNTQCEKLRAWLLQDQNIVEIDAFDESVFESAVVDNIIIIYRNEHSDNQYVKVKDLVRLDNLEEASPQHIPKTHFINSPNSQFNLNYDPKIDALLNKIRSNSTELGQIAETKDGIIQGKVADKLFLNVPIDNASKKLLFGKDVIRYRINFANNWVNYKPEEMMKLEVERRGEGVRHGLWMRKPEIFERDKLLTRQTADEIIAAYDTDNYYYSNTLHGTTITSKDYDIRFILAILNSRLTTWYYRNTTAESGKVFAQIKIKLLRQLPIPKLSLPNQQPFIELVDQIHSITKDTDYSSVQPKQSQIQAYMQQIDQLVYELYDLTPEEIALVEAAIPI